MENLQIPENYNDIKNLLYEQVALLIEKTKDSEPSQIMLNILILMKVYAA